MFKKQNVEHFEAISINLDFAKGIQEIVTGPRGYKEITYLGMLSSDTRKIECKYAMDALKHNGYEFWAVDEYEKHCVEKYAERLLVTNKDKESYNAYVKQLTEDNKRSSSSNKST